MTQNTDNLILSFGSQIPTIPKKFDHIWMPNSHFESCHDHLEQLGNNAESIDLDFFNSHVFLFPRRIIYI